MPLLPGGNDVLYGRYAVRWKADAIPGYKVAWLLWPDSEVWPRDGEIDFPEGNLDGTVEGFMHRQNGTSGGDQDHAGSAVRFGDGRWHTAVTEWLFRLAAIHPRRHRDRPLSRTAYRTRRCIG